ncbi:MAG: hypothetical protein ABIT20_08165 [Gemmatimonadaceae bacterium]
MTKRAPNSIAHYRRLDETQIVATIARLRDRIEERFPGYGLGNVSRELLALAEESSEVVDYLRRPNWPLRIIVGLVIATIFGVLGVMATTINLPTRVDRLADFVQAVDSGINDIVFLGIAVFFLTTAEVRLKRRRALASLHELRSVVHIVDMHQLTKDPERVLAGRPDTASSPTRTIPKQELGRYLDYCSELLSLASKVSALFAQHFADPVVLGAVNEIEALANGFSNKIWQKITLLDRVITKSPTVQIRDE